MTRAWSLLLLAGCGGFENEPLRTGVVRGLLSGAEANAFVDVFGQPSLSATIEPDGRFELDGLPAGKHELLAVASRSRAALVEVQVEPRRILELGALSLGCAAHLEIELLAPSGQDVGRGRLTVMGTRYRDVALNPSGEAVIGPLASGVDYEVLAVVAGLGEAIAKVEAKRCDRNHVRIWLPPPDGSEGREGCRVTGCEVGRCDGDSGKCIECTSSSQCSIGQSCVNGLCTGDRQTCASCEEDRDCGAARTCESLSGSGGKACFFRCDSGTPCPPATVCSDGLCVPDPARFNGCSAFRRLGTSCATHSECQSAGIAEGRCAGTCTYACTSTSQCLSGLTCADSGAGENVCRP